MATPDESINPRILNSASEAFLKNGYQKTSLKTICERASVTTGALYKRYSGKDELFRVLVDPAIEAMMAALSEQYPIDFSRLSNEALLAAWAMDESRMTWWFRYLFEHRTAVILLLNCSEGSSRSDFRHEWVERINEATYAYYEEAVRRGLAAGGVSRREMHVLLSAYWSSVYEPFIHGFTWPEIEAHCRRLCRFFNWQAALDFKPRAPDADGASGKPRPAAAKRTADAASRAAVVN